MNILLVDDDTATLSLLEKSLSKWGYAITKAENGIQAVEQLQHTHIDMIVSDWLTIISIWVCWSCSTA